jgi:hypothetical protein
MEALINRVAEELGVTSWKCHLEDVAPVDYAKDLVLAECLFQRGAMTIRELIENFGSKFGLTMEDPDDYYLNERYLNNIPLRQIWNQGEVNPDAERDSILTDLENRLWNDEDGIESEETITGEPAK